MYNYNSRYSHIYLIMAIITSQNGTIISKYTPVYFRDFYAPLAMIYITNSWETCTSSSFH